MLPRHENYLWEQLAADSLWASMIADGHHLPESVERCILRVKTPKRMILTCDASPLAGSLPGKYRLWDHEFEVLPIGKIVVPGTTFLGGSWAFTDLCVANVLKLAETSLADTIDMASNRPREPARAGSARRVEGRRTGRNDSVPTLVARTRISTRGNGGWRQDRELLSPKRQRWDGHPSLARFGPRNRESRHAGIVDRAISAAFSEAYFQKPFDIQVYHDHDGFTPEVGNARPGQARLSGVRIAGVGRQARAE